VYTSPNILRFIKSKNMIWAGHVACMGEMINACFFFGNLERKRPLRRPRCRWERL